MKKSKPSEQAHVGLLIDRERWNEFAMVCAAYDESATKAIQRLIKWSVEQWHIPGFEKKSKPKGI